MEFEKNSTVVTVDDDGDRRTSRLVEGQSILDAFAGWGPRMVGSSRNILRGLN